MRFDMGVGAASRAEAEGFDAQITPSTAGHSSAFRGGAAPAANLLHVGGGHGPGLRAGSAFAVDLDEGPGPEAACLRAPGGAGVIPVRSDRGVRRAGAARVPAGLGAVRALGGAGAAGRYGAECWVRICRWTESGTCGCGTRRRGKTCGGRWSRRRYGAKPRSGRTSRHVGGWLGKPVWRSWSSDLSHQGDCEYEPGEAASPSLGGVSVEGRSLAAIQAVRPPQPL